VVWCIRAAVWRKDQIGGRRPRFSLIIQKPETIDLREVAGKRVNMRSGPGTNFDVLDTLNRGTQAEVIEVNADGWARIRITDSDQIGWMAERLLTNS